MKKRTMVSARGGFTMIEVLIAALILLPVLVLVVFVFIECMRLNELSRNSFQALLDVRNKMAEIEGTPFANIKATYDQVTFTSASLNGIGVSYVDDSQANALEVTVTFSWWEKDGRVIGDDANLDGAIDAGEDDDNNNILDSPVMITTVFSDV